MKNEFRSNLSKAKNLGSAKEGLNHWLSLRWTSVALIPLTFWFVIKVIYLFKLEGRFGFEILKSPFDFICFMMFMVVSLYHGMLGMQVIIEDYVHCKISKRVMISSVYSVSIVSIIALIVALFRYYSYFS